MARKFDFDLNPMYNHHNPRDNQKRYHVYEIVGDKRITVETFTYKRFAKEFVKGLNDGSMRPIE